MTNRINEPDLEVSPENVLVLQNAGPVGAPGMPEAGMIPIPSKLLKQGVRDMVRISDARMSGTAYGTVVLHVAPESAIGGPLAAVRDGDEIELDVVNRQLILRLSESEIEDRLKNRPKPLSSELTRRGHGWLYVNHVQQADLGCDFDFCAADWGRMS
jgi:dihydroxy-acid dehydratase